MDLIPSQIWKSVSKIKHVENLSTKRRRKQEQSLIIGRWCTVVWAMEVHEELLHPIVQHLHLVVTHHPTRKKKKERKKLFLFSKKVNKTRFWEQSRDFFPPAIYSFMRSISRRLLGEDIPIALPWPAPAEMEENEGGVGQAAPLKIPAFLLRRKIAKREGGLWEGCEEKQRQQ